MNILKNHRVRFFLFISIILIYFNCAEVVSPPGGEEDKKAPYLVSSLPPNGAVNVTPANRIELYFSEPIVKPGVDNPIYFSPRLKEKPKIKWKSNRVIIELDENFRPDETYIISVQPNLSDLRNNKLDSAITIAFSTGDSIDSGRVAGFVYNNGKPHSNALLALYDLAKYSDSIPYDSAYPDYLNVSSQLGYFSFQYLPPREYRLLAFNDKNKDERFNPFFEEFALPDRPVKIGGEVALDNLLMTMTALDTSRVNILSVVLNPDNLLKIRLTRSIPLFYLRLNPSHIVLFPAGDTAAAVYATSFQENNLDESSILNVYFRSITSGNYILKITYEKDKPELVFKNIELAVKEDKTPPAVLEFIPGAQPVFLSEAEIKLGFSEPLDTAVLTDHTFFLREDDTLNITVEKKWLDPFHLSLIPANLKPGSKYRLDITEFDIVDLVGNPMGDSLLSYNFSILNIDSLGAISGDILISLPGVSSNPVILTFDEQSRKQSFTTKVTGNHFKIDVPAGRYLLSGYIDIDLNEKLSPGVLYPFRPAETMAFYPDTIRVRPRFETSEITFEFK